MASVSYKGEFVVLDDGEGTKSDTCPPEFLGSAPGTIDIDVEGWEPGTYVVMVSRKGAPATGGGDQNKEGGSAGSTAR